MNQRENISFFLVIEEIWLVATWEESIYSFFPLFLLITKEPPAIAGGSFVISLKDRFSILKGQFLCALTTFQGR
jgi:hypothetical protein